MNRGNPLLYGGTSPFALPDGSGVGEIRSTESSAKSLYQGVTFTLNRRFADRFQFQVNYLLSFDKSDDDNERDPFTFRYADLNNFEPEYNWSDRDQRHRFNAFATFLLPWEIIPSVKLHEMVKYHTETDDALPACNGHVHPRDEPGQVRQPAGRLEGHHRQERRHPRGARIGFDLDYDRTRFALTRGGVVVIGKNEIVDR